MKPCNTMTLFEIIISLPSDLIDQSLANLLMKSNLVSLKSNAENELDQACKLFQISC